MSETEDMKTKGLTHVDGRGQAHMVDVGTKYQSRRVATASGRVRTKPEVIRLIEEGKAAKGDVLATARIAGIMAAKKTSELIPLCHPLAIESVSVDLELEKDAVLIRATAKITGKTGVEMEALTAASVAALTIYDMLKAVDRAMVIEQIQLEEKSGGKSGHFTR